MPGYGVLCRVFPEFGYKYPRGESTPHFPVVNFSKQLTLLAELCDNREADRRGMKSLEFRRLHPDGMAKPYCR